MKINEVEAQVGITKKNIRFYEEQGLLSPSRNSENGYRDYGPEEVIALRQIKLLRKLGLPLEEIRRMQQGGSTVADGMRRHLVTLEREQRNLEQSMELCRKLKNREERLEFLDAAALLEEMERMEREGTTFKDKQVGDMKRIRYVAPTVVAILMTALMAGVIALMVWAFTLEPAEAPPMPLMVLLIAIPVVVILGVLLALYQRLKEIREGEEDDAKNY
ncbi:MAG: MerR family transcriptional regulator [Lawsonibacter sp.]